RRGCAECVRAVAPPPPRHPPAEPPGVAARGVWAEVGTPEDEPIACSDARHVGGVEQLGEVLQLPDAPRPGMVAQAMQVDQAYSPAPVLDGPAEVFLTDIEVAEIEVLVEMVPVVQQAGKPGH